MNAKALAAASAALVAVASCTNDNAYVIKGTVTEAANGDTVFLCDMLGRCLDTTVVVSDSLFIFEGTIETADSTTYAGARHLVRCTSQDEGKNLSAGFFLEPGSIEISLAENKRGNRPKVATGTPLNNAMAAIAQRTDSLEALYTSTYEKRNATNLSESARSAISQELDDIENAMRDDLLESMNANVENPLGLYLLSKTYYYFDEGSKLDSLLKKMPSYLRKDPNYVNFAKRAALLTTLGEGKPFADIVLPDSLGMPDSLSHYVGRGKAVLVDFWASWCGPCRRATPELVKLYEKHSDNLEIVGVSLDSKKEAWIAATKNLGMTWKHISDLKNWKSAGAQTYGIVSIPTTVLIDKNGNIVGRNLSIAEIEEAIGQ